jgi:hypothetical protein
MKKRLLWAVIAGGLVLTLALFLGGCPTEADPGPDPATPDTTAPARVDNLTGSYASGEVTLTWTDPADEDLDHIEITFTPVAEGVTQPVTVPKGTQTVTITGLTDNTEYQFVFRAVDTGGNKSTARSKTLNLDLVPPAEVSGLGGTPGNGQVSLNWTDPADADFDHVEITWTPDGNTPVTVEKGGKSKVINSLTDDIEYTFTVKAVDTLGNKSTGVSIPLTPVSDTPKWTSLTIAGSTYPLKTVVWDGSQIVGIAGSDENDSITAYSTDWETWTWDSTPEVASLNKMVWNGSIFVAVGYYGKIAYSEDGENWTVVTDSAFASNQTIYDIAWGGSAGEEKFVAVGASGKIAYSEDGENWTAVSDSVFGTNAIRAIVWGGSAGQEKFVAVGASAKMAYSEDGENWTAVSDSKFSSKSTIFTVIYAEDKFFAGGTSGQIASSADGTTWTNLGTGKLGLYNSSYPNITSIAYGGGKFVIGGASGQMAWSLDGETWIPAVDTKFENTIFEIRLAYVSGKFFATNDSTTMAYSNTQE